jgi:DNA polymerase-3 subunit gamma/tau
MQRTILKKYAVKTFDDIIGQQYIVSFFKNSLYKNIFYPLYLLAGMRGTGKTTCARLFAAAALVIDFPSFKK